MPARVRLGVSEALYLRPLLAGLDAEDSPFQLVTDLPAVNAVRINERTSDIRCAFLSPIDYARHAGSYRMVPGVAVSSDRATNTITFTVGKDVRNIRKVAVDIRVTSEIILAKILLIERLKNMPGNGTDIEFIPMMPSLDTMLQKADAALIVNLAPSKAPPSNLFSLDLVEEWNDMTGLPYVHGFWVAREEDLSRDAVDALIRARDRGVADLERAIHLRASEYELPQDNMKTYFDSFRYDFGEDVVDGLNEFATMAYYHGVLGDVPDINFFDSSHAN